MKRHLEKGRKNNEMISENVSDTFQLIDPTTVPHEDDEPLYDSIKVRSFDEISA